MMDLDSLVIAGAAALGVALVVRRRRAAADVQPPAPIPIPIAMPSSGPYATAWAVSTMPHRVYPAGAPAGLVPPPDSPIALTSAASDCGVIVVMDGWWTHLTETLHRLALQDGIREPVEIFDRVAGDEPCLRASTTAAAAWRVDVDAAIKEYLGAMP